MSLCDIPSPPPDLVEKYDQMKSVFYKRLITAYGKLQAAVAPLVDNVDSEKTQAVKEYIETLQTKPEFQAVAKVAVWVKTYSLCILKYHLYLTVSVEGTQDRWWIHFAMEMCLNNVSLLIYAVAWVRR